MDKDYDGSKESNRRVSPRRYSGASAWADPGGILPVIDCKILDISDEGAKVRSVRGGPLPDRFILQHETFSVVGEAEVQWRQGSVAGVKLDRT